MESKLAIKLVPGDMLGVLFKDGTLGAVEVLETEIDGNDVTVLTRDENFYFYTNDTVMILEDSNDQV